MVKRQRHNRFTTHKQTEWNTSNSSKIDWVNEIRSKKTAKLQFSGFIKEYASTWL